MWLRGGVLTRPPTRTEGRDQSTDKGRMVRIQQYQRRPEKAHRRSQTSPTLQLNGTAGNRLRMRNLDADNVTRKPSTLHPTLDGTQNARHNHVGLQEK